MSQEVFSNSEEIIEESIFNIAITGIAATGLRLFNQLPYAGYIRFSEDVVVPSALILLHTASQLSTRQNSHKSRQLIETAVGAVAYAQITSKYNPGFYINELAYMAKNGMNLLFFMCETPLEMGSVAAGKLIIGTLMDECSTSVLRVDIKQASLYRTRFRGIPLSESVGSPDVRCRFCPTFGFKLVTSCRLRSL